MVLTAKDPSEWKPGKLVNLDVGSRSKVVGVNGIVTTKVRRVFTYSVDGIGCGMHGSVFRRGRCEEVSRTGSVTVAAR